MTETQGAESAAAFEREVKAGALVFCNHSGGKDSQAMYLHLRERVPSHQLIVIHADLGELVEWSGVKEHIRSNIDGRTLELAHAYYKDGSSKDLLGYIRRRGMWPSNSTRFCTSELKTGPIMREAGRIMRERGSTRAINCLGIRAEESPARAKALPWKFNKRFSSSRRTFWNYNPIFQLKEAEVFAAIKAAGQTPHWAYGAGMQRLSCSFCVLAGQSDLRTAAKLRPDLLQIYLDLEKEIGHTFQSKRTLAEITA